MNDFNRDDLLDILAINRDEGEDHQDGLRLLLGVEQGKFQDPGQSISVRTGGKIEPSAELRLIAAVSADFNQDNNPDFAILSQSTPGQVFLFLGDGNGSFPIENRTVLNFGEPVHPVAMTVGDVDQTGTPDLIVLAEDQLFFFDDPSRNILPKAIIHLENPARALAVGHLNTDSILDVAIAFDSKVSTLLGRGSFEFEKPMMIDQRPGITPRSIAVADMDHNEAEDILVAHDGSLATATLYLGNGFGQFPEFMDIGSTTARRDGPQSLAIGDFDKDGNIDFAAVNSDFGHRNVTIFRGYAHVKESGYGEHKYLEFEPYETIPATELPKKMFEGEVVPNTGPSRDGQFDSEDDEAPYALYIEDIDEDGDPDVVTANFSHHGISVLTYDIGFELSVTPSSATVNPRVSQNFTINNGNEPFSVEFIENNSGGTIIGPDERNPRSFSYTAGSKVGVTDIVQVTDSTSEIRQSVTVSIEVIAQLSVNPPNATVNPGESQTFAVLGVTFFTVKFIENNSGGSIEGPIPDSEIQNVFFIYHAGQTGGVTDTVIVTGSNEQSVTVPITVLGKVNLTIDFSGLGTGRVNATPGPSSSEVNVFNDVTLDYANGTTVTLSAFPTNLGDGASASTFAGWSGEGCSSDNSTITVAMTQNRTCTATFQPRRTVTVTKAGTGSGTVTGPGINCGTDCTHTATDNTPVTLIATPSEGSVFIGWSVTGSPTVTCSGTAPCPVPLNANRTVTATFTQNEPPMVNAGPDQAITLPAGVTLNGIVSDDGLPNPTVTTTWEGVSGPAPVSFANAAAIATTATFTQPGLYVLRLTANDGALSTSDTAAITVNPPPLPVPVPNIVGQTQANAEAALVAANLTVGTITPQASFVDPSGNVISQTPSAGTVVTQGTAVALVVSAGPPTEGVTTLEDGADVNPGDGICEANNGRCTLRAAIQEANANTENEGETITLIPGMYKLTIKGANEDGAATGDLDITDALVISSNTGNAADVIITGQSLGDRIFDLPQGSPLVTLRGLTIQNGNVTGLTGGGIRNVQGSLTLENSVVTANRSDRSGGGLSHLGGSLVLRNTIVSNNNSQGRGGGIQAQEGTVEISESQIRGNRANFGGGVSTGGATVNITNSTITGNSALDGGGGIYKFLHPNDLFDPTAAPKVRLNGTTILNNQTMDCEGFIIIDGFANTIGSKDGCNLLDDSS